MKTMIYLAKIMTISTSILLGINVFSVVDPLCEGDKKDEYWILQKKKAEKNLGFDKVRSFVLKNGFLNWCSSNREKYIAGYQLSLFNPDDIQLVKSSPGLFKKKILTLKIGLYHESRARNTLTLYLCNEAICSDENNLKLFYLLLKRRLKIKEKYTRIAQKNLREKNQQERLNNLVGRLNAAQTKQFRKACPCLDKCKKGWVSFLYDKKLYCPVTVRKLSLFSSSGLPEKCEKFKKHLQHTKGRRWYRECDVKEG